MTITPLMIAFGLASAVVLTATWILARSTKVPILGRQHHQPFNPVTIVMGAAIAALLYDIGQQQGNGAARWTLFDSLFHLVQMIGANASPPDFAESNLPSLITFLYHVYTPIIFIAAPATTVLAIGSLLVRHLTLPVSIWRSHWRDTFVLSSLSPESLALGKSIAMTYERGIRAPDGPLDRDATKRPCIVYCCMRDDADVALAHEARDFEALCVESSPDELLRLCSPRSRRVFVVCEPTDAESIALAASLDRIARPIAKKGGCDLQVVFISQLRGAETIVYPQAMIGERKPKDKEPTSVYRLRGVDVVRETVIHAVERYPTFLLEKPTTALDSAPDAVDDEDGKRSFADCAWMSALYEDRRRHVAVIGPGHTGTEFVCAALWCSRLDGMETRIDIIGHRTDSSADDAPFAQTHLEQRAPEILDPESGYDIRFFLADAQTSSLDRYLVENAQTLTYLFVSLGDDLLTARVAMRCRSILERELAKRSDDRATFIYAPRPLIVATIRDDELCQIVQDADNDGIPYNIHCVGSRVERYSYKRIVWNRSLDKDREKYLDKGTQPTEYKRRQSQASDVHKKYKLFAFCRRLHQGKLGLPEEKTERLSDLEDLLPEVDWRQSISELQESVGPIAEAYDDYIWEDTGALDTGNGSPNHQWLLEMEHERWNAYTRTEGMYVATVDLASTIFDTGQTDDERHRHNLAGLHPCLVSFDDLDTIDGPIKEMYDSRGIKRPYSIKGTMPDGSPKTFQLQDDNYISILKRDEWEKKNRP